MKIHFYLRFRSLFGLIQLYIKPAKLRLPKGPLSFTTIPGGSPRPGSFLFCHTSQLLKHTPAYTGA